jgi:serine kinase of HPr protein (carbohydrate metabolism regulator)
MNLSLIKDQFGFELLNKKEDLSREISGLYCCDLLSWVMANGKQDNVWVTVQVHGNILAVASLLDFSCIVIPEGIKVEEDLIEKADEEGIMLFSTSLDSYHVFQKFYEAGIK